MKQALIIGGSTGMGKATAERLLNKGIEVAIVARPGSNLETVAQQLSALDSVESFGVDLSKMGEMARFIETLVCELPHNAYLVNAAAYFKLLPFLKHTQADYNTYPDLIQR